MAKNDSLTCLQWLARCRRHLCSDSRRRRVARPKRSCTESLEFRSLLTTFTVTSLADSGSGSLRQAILDANATAGDDEILFQSGLNGTIALTSGQMTISETVEITGNGAANSIIDAQETSRIFEISSGAVSLSGLTLQNGRTAGNNINYADNTNNGGAIKSLSSGTLTISGSTLTGNSTFGGGAHGGAISSDTGAIVIIDSILSGNRTTGDGAYGGGLFCRSGEVTITRSTLSGNLTEGASSDGGAIFIANGSISIKQSTLASNSTMDVFADGGAVFARNNSVVLSQSTVSGNSVQGNGARGGAVFSGYGTVTVSQSTLTLNSSTQNAGGGIFSNSGSISIRNSIVAGNTDNGSAPDVQRSLDVGDTLSIASSLIGRNNGTDLATTGMINPDANGNWIGGNTVPAAVDPMLVALADNGGSTMTHALLENSPAFNAGSSLLAVDILDNDVPLTTDQRGAGFSRIQFGRPDMGAFESATLDSPDGTTSSDTFVLAYSSTSTSGNVVVTISADGGAVREIGTFPMNLPLTINGLGGSDSVRVEGTSGADTIIVNSSTGLTVNGASLILTSIETTALAGAAGSDAYKFDADAALGLWTLDESGGGTDTIDLSLTAAAVTINLGLAGTQVVHPANLSLILSSAITFENAVGGDGADTMTGNELDNVLTGGPGDDTLNGGAGSDVLFGGANNDTYVFTAAAAAEADQVTENTNEGTDTISFAALTTNVALHLGSNLTQAVHTNRTLKLNSPNTFENSIGGSGADSLAGNAAGNTLTGGVGDDRLNGGAGSDLLFGGLNNDTYLFDATAVAEADQVTENTDEGTDTISFAALTTNVVLHLGSNAIQNVHTNRTLKLNSPNTFENSIGGSGVDFLAGNGGNNTLTGGPGGDRLNGGAGSDLLLGGLNNDTYQFTTASVAEADQVTENTNEGTDTISFAALTTNVALHLGSNLTQAVHTNRTLKLNSPNTFENSIGGSGADSLAGNAAGNTLTGGVGDDRLNGGAGSDLLFGGLNNDTYLFDATAVAEADQVTENTNEGVDTISFATQSNAVVLNLGLTTVQAIHTNRTLKLNSASTFENATGGSGSDTLIGNALANRLTGGNGDNILVGLDGTDILEAGSGRDFLIGGLGLDTLNGGSNDDILIAGRTTSDTSFSNLNTIRTEWISGNSYATRIANLRAGVGSPIVSLKATINVLNDAGEDDSLTGGTNSDWFFRAMDDVITDLFAGEITDVL